MPSEAARQRDVLYLLIGIQLSVFVAIFPDLLVLLLPSVLLFLNVLFNEAIRWLDDYAEG